MPHPGWLASVCTWSPPGSAHADPSITHAHVISDQLTEAADIFVRALAVTSSRSRC